jgi:superfamily II DNA/RNA helicase
MMQFCILLNKCIQEVELAVNMSAMTLNDNVVKGFEKMGLDADILKGIYGYGLEKPAYIQERAIVPCIKGKDAIVQAQSGM